MTYRLRIEALSQEVTLPLIKLVPETSTAPKYEVVAAANAADISRRDVRDYMKIVLREKRLFKCKIRDGSTRSEIHLSRHEETAS